MAIETALGSPQQARTTLAIANFVTTKTANYTLAAADRGNTIRFTSIGPNTATLDIVANMGLNFICQIRNDTSTNLTINTNGGLTINGGASIVIQQGITITVFCDNINYFTSGDFVNPVPLNGGTMTGYLILNADPVNPLGAATKEYVDMVASGISVQNSCYAASTANLNATYANGAAGVGATLTNAGAQAAFSIDGVSPPLNSRILIKDQVTQADNGCYTLTTIGNGSTNWVLTRATDYDTAPGDIHPGTLFIVQNGNVNNLSSWIETATVNTIGTDAIVFAQFTTSPSNFAKIDLSNLASTAVNADIIPDTDSARSLGSAAINWENFYVEDISSGSAGGATLKLNAINTVGDILTPFVTLTTGNPPTCALDGAVTGVTQAGGTNTTQLATTAFVHSAVAAQAPDTSTYLLQVADAALPNAQALGALATGLVKNTTVTGVQSIAILGTDYYGPGGAPINVPNGGTGDGSFTPYTVICGGTTATGNLQNVASVGTAGYVLTSNGAGALPSFQAAAGGGGGLTWIASVTAANSATVNFSNNLSGTYDNYLIVFEDVLPVNNAVNFGSKVGTGGGPTYKTGNYSGFLDNNATAYNPSANQLDIVSFGNSTGQLSNSGGHGGCGTILITNVNNGAAFTSTLSQMSYTVANTFAVGLCTGAYQYQISVVLTSFQFLMSSGNISTGTFKLYGYQN